MDSGILKRFSTVFDLPKSPFNAIKTVRRTIDKVQPDVIHCHSSFGGVYGRFGGRNFPGLVVYSPHCYAFERRDVNNLTRCLYRVVEKYLSRWTDVVAACSHREKLLAKEIGGRSGFRSVFVPNLSALPAHYGGERENIVVGVGRLSPQKDPELFAEVAHEFLGHETRFVWVGDGEEDYLHQLEASGVEVLGWKSQKEVEEILSRAKVYLHTALWEGFPITLLDAKQGGLAIVVRDENYLKEMPTIGRFTESSGAHKMIQDYLTQPDELAKNIQAWQGKLSENTKKVARERLLEVYKIT
jgi:glycosyltransferase involved in cell wall biosynthesis